MHPLSAETSSPWMGQHSQHVELRPLPRVQGSCCWNLVLCLTYFTPLDMFLHICIHSLATIRNFIPSSSFETCPCVQCVVSQRLHWPCPFLTCGHIGSINQLVLSKQALQRLVIREDGELSSKQEVVKFLHPKIHG